MKWEYNDYIAPDWNGGEPNVIHFYAIIDEADIVIEVCTCSEAEELPPGVDDIVVDPEDALDLYDIYEIAKYKIVSNEVVARTAEEKLADQKEMKRIHIKEDYMNDVVWTDDCKMCYDKYKIKYPSGTMLDAWFTAYMNYWDESWIEFLSNRTAIDNATSQTQLDAIVYAPTHELTKEEVDALF